MQVWIFYIMRDDNCKALADTDEDFVKVTFYSNEHDASDLAKSMKRRFPDNRYSVRKVLIQLREPSLAPIDNISQDNMSS